MRKVLVLGEGGREHALAWRLALCDQTMVLVAPGNAGTASTPNVKNVPALNTSDHHSVARWCREHKVDLVVVGPETPLAEGIADVLANHEVLCFGPSKLASQIESSKAFSKAFMDRHKIPTARWRAFTDEAAAVNHILSADYPALVVKASGLAAGKGVVVAKTREEAVAAARSMLSERMFGDSGSVIVIEELLEGQEVSCLAFCDGTCVVPMPPCQDFKRACDGDLGPNTGGMGAYCPVPFVTPEDLQTIYNSVLLPAVQGLRQEGMPFIGVLYAGMMLTKHGPQTLEFNCRFGDPETQVLMPLFKNDLYSVMEACARGDLPSCLPEFNLDHAAVTVVMASGGYPGKCDTGHVIHGLEAAKNILGVEVFYAAACSNPSTNSVVASGGRVLNISGCSSSLNAARSLAYSAVRLINWEHSFYRTDIALQVILSSRESTTYKGVGVDTQAGDNLVDTLRPLALSTRRQGCNPDLGGYGGLFDLKAAGFQDPVLVSGTDGVGTKLKIAQKTFNHSTVGIDLVAMCVNDVLAHGAEPLFFLDYYASGKLDVKVASEVLEGIAQGCKEAGCSLIGGETAEMPGFYTTSEYDIAGFAVGAVERSDLLPKIDSIRPGDKLIGLPSSGLHSNGFSLVRRVVEGSGLQYSSPCPFPSSGGQTLGDELLKPTCIYVSALLPLMRKGSIKAFAHITGGGIVENLPRVIPKSVSAELDVNLWPMPPVFHWLRAAGNIPYADMATTFNLGLGGIIVVDPSVEDHILSHLRSSGLQASVVGQLTDRNPDSCVILRNLEAALSACQPTALSEQLVLRQQRKRVAVLVSGSGTNLQALIDHCQSPSSHSEIVLVISNIPGAFALERACKAGILSKVIHHKNYPSRLSFDMALHDQLKLFAVDIVCLAGFMRILGPEFVSLWQGRLINIHPSLLPSFRGLHAQQQAINSGVRVSGCTVHFVEAEVDSGAIIAQETVVVYPEDTAETLEKRIKCQAEHKAYPRALELVASGRVTLSSDGKLVWSSCSPSQPGEAEIAC